MAVERNADGLTDSVNKDHRMDQMNGVTAECCEIDERKEEGKTSNVMTTDSGVYSKQRHKISGHEKIFQKEKEDRGYLQPSLL